jgi:hypothetical protein
METIKVYDINELKEQFPDAFEYAHRKFCEYIASDRLPWQDEIMDSMKATFKLADVELTDWEISDCSQSYVKFYMGGEVKELEGNRALAWFENNLFWKLRETRPFQNRVKYYSGKPYNFTHYGKMKDCPLTGYCADEDFLGSLIEDIKGGCTISDAFHNLADVAAKLFRNEYEYTQSEEYFIEHAEANDYKYTEDGVMI